MDTRTASLGVEAQRVPAIEPDAARAPGERDAGDASSVPPDVDAAEGGDDDDEQERDDDGRSEDLDEAPRARDVGPPAPSLDAASDAGAPDTSVARPDSARDAAREDAKAPVNPLCIAEPWHCQ
jgi:hypothetical protein